MKIQYEDLLTSPYFEKLIDSLIVFAVLLTVYIVLSKIIKRKAASLNEQYNWQKVSGYLIVCCGLFFIGRIWIHAIQPMFAFFGIIAAALTISQKESIMNLTGGLFIIWRSLFAVGDRIQIGEFRGDVVGNGIFYFILLEVGDADGSNQSTGRILRIPNGLVLNNPIVNYTQYFSYIWREISVVIQPGGNREKAMDILQAIVEKHGRKFIAPARKAVQKTQKKEAIIFRHFSPKVYMTVQMEQPAGIRLTARFICEVRATRDTEMEIWKDLLNEFDRHEDISISYET